MFFFPFSYTSAGADAHPASPSGSVSGAGASGLLSVPRSVMEMQHEYCKYVCQIESYRIYLLSYLLVILFTFYLIYLLSYLLVILFTCYLIYLLSYLLVILFTCYLIYLLSYLLVILFT